MQRIAGKVVWVRGASSGIGEALAYALDKKNCKLILSSRYETAIKRVKGNYTHKNNIEVLPLDLRDLSKTVSP